ncbi:hypothetical protein DIPPA_00177 [Diplonema papillatum]|nr:hypothetical protein DIPPA_00177 [Diplonema papillatum]
MAVHRSLYIATLVAVAGALVIPPSDPHGPGVPLGLVFIQGANISVSQYRPTVLAIQTTFQRPLYVGLPEFPGKFAEPELFEFLVSSTLGEMVREGLPKGSQILLAGHSLGGAVSMGRIGKNFTMAGFDLIGQVLMGSFITREFRDPGTQRLAGYPKPTLTLAGELDGLCRVSRIVEQFYVQEQSYGGAFAATFPVVVIPGMSHMQFASGEIPYAVYNSDLVPEIGYDEAHRAVAELIWSFFQTVAAAGGQVDPVLLEKVGETRAFVRPFVEAYQWEGSYHLENPCYCGQLTCTGGAACAGGSRWTDRWAQRVMAGYEFLPENSTVSLDATDSFHPVTHGTLFYANINATCASPYEKGGCTVRSTTVTQNVYPPEDVVDTGFRLSSAYEMRVKLKSREAMYAAVGLANVSEEDVCFEINQKAVDHALAAAPQRTVSRFSRVGEPLRVGPDIVSGSGPAWDFPPLNLTRECDGGSRRFVTVVRAQSLYTPVDCTLGHLCGSHYCKLLSPARAMEWLYLDGLRLNLSLVNQGKANTC